AEIEQGPPTGRGGGPSGPELLVSGGTAFRGEQTGMWLLQHAMNTTTRERGVADLRSWLGIAFGTGLLLATMTVSAFAQGATGGMTGTVKDAQGGVIPGAPVTLISETR